MKAKSIKGQSPAEVLVALDESVADGFAPTIAIVFLSIKQDWKAVSQILDQRGISIFGVSSAGEFIDGEVGEDSIAIMLLDVNRSAFSILFEDTGTRSTRAVATQMAEKSLALISHPAFIVCGSGVTADGEMIIRGIEDAAGKEVTIFGGMASDDYTMTGTFVFTNEMTSDNGIIILALDQDKFDLHGMATCGWQAVGTVKTITKSEGCWVYTIDDQPALDMIVRYMGIKSLNKEKNNEILMNIGANFPMQVERENGSVIMRTAMLGNWNDRSFMCAGSVPQGAKIRFTLPPDFEVIESVISACEDVKETKLPAADAMILFSCKARQTALGPLVGKEIQGLKDVWNTPMAGYFAYGEFGKATGGEQEFHNITCCWVALREK